MEEKRELSNKPLHLFSVDFRQNKERQVSSTQQMVLGKQCLIC